MRLLITTERVIPSDEARALYESIKAVYAQGGVTVTRKFPDFSEWLEKREMTLEDKYPGGWVKTTYKILED